MNNDIRESKPQKRNITWQVQMPAPACEHTFELIAHEENGATKRCTKCGYLETEWTPGQP